MNTIMKYRIQKLKDQKASQIISGLVSIFLMGLVGIIFLVSALMLVHYTLDMLNGSNLEIGLVIFIYIFLLTMLVVYMEMVKGEIKDQAKLVDDLDEIIEITSKLK